MLAFHTAVPNTVGHLGNLAETFLPWLGLTIPVVFWWCRSAVASLAALLPVVAWLSLFGDHLPPSPDSTDDITAVQHNVSDDNADPAATVRELLRVRPDLVALEELTPSALPTYPATLAAEYPHHTVQGTVGLWSRYPLAEARLVDIRPRGVGADWNRGLRAVRECHGATLRCTLPTCRRCASGSPGLRSIPPTLVPRRTRITVRGPARSASPRRSARPAVRSRSSRRGRRDARR